MKQLRLLILLGTFICSHAGWSQVFGYPGATWIFYRPDFHPASWEQHEKWTYTGDTLIAGDSAKIVHQHRINYTPVMPPHWFHADKDYFFKVNGDTVFIHHNVEGWVEVYNFSLEVGDTVHSPLKDAYYFDQMFMNCDLDTIGLYNMPATVINTGTVFEDGVPLQYYTVQFSIIIDDGLSGDTILTTHTYFERTMISYPAVDSYWFPWDEFPCLSTYNEALPVGLVCYKDDQISTSTVCDDLSWFDHVSVPIEEQGLFIIYPNPTKDMLRVENFSSMNDTYSIISMDGKIILSQVQSPINVSQFTPGIYLLTNSKGSRYQKFIKN